MATLSYASAGQYYTVKPLDRRAGWARWLCLGMAATELLFLITLGVMLWAAPQYDVALERYENSPVNSAEEQAALNDMNRLNLVETLADFFHSVVQFPIMVGFWVAFGMWIFRAVGNARAATGDSYKTPGWSVGWWFIPFANLVVPYFILRDLYERSGRAEVHGGGLPRWIWFGFIGSIVLAVIALIYWVWAEDAGTTLTFDAGVNAVLLTLATAGSIGFYLGLRLLIGRVTQSTPTEVRGRGWTPSVQVAANNASA